MNNKVKYISEGFKFIQTELQETILLGDDFYLLVNNYENDLSETISDVKIICTLMRGINYDYQLVYKSRYPDHRLEKIMRLFLEYQELYNYKEYK